MAQSVQGLAIPPEGRLRVVAAGPEGLAGECEFRISRADLLDLRRRGEVQPLTDRAGLTGVMVRPDLAPCREEEMGLGGVLHARHEARFHQLEARRMPPVPARNVLQTRHGSAPRTGLLDSTTRPRRCSA